MMTGHQEKKEHFSHPKNFLFPILEQTIIMAKD
jgi:hypothetical protein